LMAGKPKNRRLTARPPFCRLDYTMTNKRTIAETLRTALNESGLSFLALERESGVIRQSLMPFARGEASISLDAADKLAVYFGLELQPATRKAAKKADPKRKGN